MKSRELATKAIIVFDAHAVRIDELIEGVFLGEQTQVSVVRESWEEFSCNGSSGRRWGCVAGVGGIGTDLLVGFPIGLLAFTRAVGSASTSGTAL